MAFEPIVKAFTPVIVAFILAFLTESIVEYVLGKPMDNSLRLKPFKWTLQYIALAVGILLCFHYWVDLIATIVTLVGGEIQTDWVGVLLSGFVVGRGSNFTHDFLVNFISAKPWQEVTP